MKKYNIKYYPMFQCLKKRFDYFNIHIITFNYFFNYLLIEYNYYLFDLFYYFF